MGLKTTNQIIRKNRFEKLKNIIGDEFGVIVTSEDSRINFACEQIHDFYHLEVLIDRSFGLDICLGKLSTIGDILDELEKVSK